MNNTTRTLNGLTHARGGRRTVRAIALIAAGGLALGTAACKDDSGSGSTDGTVSGTSAGTSAGTSGSDPVTDVSQLPDEIAEAFAAAGGESGDLGAFRQFITSGDRTLATFANGWIVYSPDTGAQTLIGEIGADWIAGGGLDNPVGLPTGPEAGDAGSGWDQTFQNGSVGWHPDSSGTWGVTGDGASSVTGQGSGTAQSGQGGQSQQGGQDQGAQSGQSGQSQQGGQSQQSDQGGQGGQQGQGQGTQNGQSGQSQQGGQGSQGSQGGQQGQAQGGDGGTSPR